MTTVTMRKVAVLAALLAAAVPATAVAKHGSDDRGAAKRGRGGDDGPGDDNGGRGGDDGGNDDKGGDDDGDDDGGDDNGGSGGGGGSWTRARQALVRDAASPDADTYGKVEVRTRSGRQRFSVEAERLDAGTVVEVFVADAGSSMVSAGSAVADFTGEAELELDTGDGASLPAGAATASDLAGRRVEVRLADGSPLLFGTVPGLSGGAGGGSKERAKTVVRDGDSGAKVKVEIRADGKAGRERLKVEVEHLVPGAAVVLRIADASGTLADAATGTALASGRVEWKWDTKKGAALPAGAASVRELQGRAFEIAVEGAAVAAGTVPSF